MHMATSFRAAASAASVASCSYQFQPTSFTAATGTRRTCSRRRLVVQAQEQQPENRPTGTPAAVQDEEARLEALEAAMRSKKSMKASGGRPTSLESSSSTGGLAEWKEGELFPEGWDQMSPFQKVAELYVGKRGFLFWSAKLALNGVIALAAAWALFRFVGPALGLYQLANDINTPNF